MSTEFDPSVFADIPDPLAAAPAERAAATATPPAQVIAAAAAEAGPTAGELRRRRWIAAGAAVLWLFFVLALEGVRQDFSWTPLLLLQSLLPALLSAGAWWLAMSPGPVGLGPSARTVVAFAVLAPLTFVASAFLSPCLVGPPIARHAFLCGDWILLLGAISLGIVAMVQRRTVAAGAHHKSLLLGISAGFGAAAVHSLHCDNTTGVHVAIGHTWPVVVLGLMGLFFVRRAVRA